MKTPRIQRSVAGLLLVCLILCADRAVPGTEPPGKDDPPEEPKKLNEAIEKSVTGTTCCPKKARRR